MRTYNSGFIYSEFLEDDKIVSVDWLPSTDSLKEEGFKKEALDNLEFILSCQPKKILSNTLDLKFYVHPELQIWFNQNVLAKELEIGVQKIAIVVSPDLITQLSVEQTMGEKVGEKFTTRFFDNKDEAKEWLVQDENK